MGKECADQIITDYYPEGIFSDETRLFSKEVPTDAEMAKELRRTST